MINMALRKLESARLFLLKSDWSIFLAAYKNYLSSGPVILWWHILVFNVPGHFFLNSFFFPSVWSYRSSFVLENFSLVISLSSCSVLLFCLPSAEKLTRCILDPFHLTSIFLFQSLTYFNLFPIAISIFLLFRFLYLSWLFLLTLFFH